MRWGLLIFGYLKQEKRLKMISIKPLLKRFKRSFSTSFFLDFMATTNKELDRQIMQFFILKDRYGIDMSKEIEVLRNTRDMLKRKIEEKESWLIFKD
jgi:hypothetical protein